MAAGDDQAVASSGEPISEMAVRQYLMENPDFLQCNPDLLDFLQVNHATGSAISLVEKQVSVLRERNIDMRRRLSGLTTNARNNDELYDLTRKLVLQLIEAGTPAQMAAAFSEAMSRDFDVEHACCIVFDETLTPSPGLRVERREDADAAIGSLLRGESAVCGALRDTELRYLFPEGGKVGSAALVALRDGDIKGVVAVGSSDANRYNNTVGTLFLSHLADVMVRILARSQAGEPG